MDVLLFTIPFALSLGALPGVMWLANRRGFLDNPVGDVLKIHKKATPHLGGAAVFFSFVISIGVFALPLQKINLNSAIIALVFSSFLFVLLGIWDDLRWKHITAIKPRLKLLLLIGVSMAASVILFEAEITMRVIPIVLLEIPLAFLYILGLVNAINFEDGLDGLAGGVGILSLAGFSFIGFVMNLPVVLVVSLVCLGGFAAFLIFNFPPAKIFMGDAGAFFLGFILVSLALILSRPLDILSVLGPILIIGLPVFDTAATIMRRIFNKTSPFLGDRDHLYDKMFKKTGSLLKTLVFHYVGQAVLVTVGILLYLQGRL